MIETLVLGTIIVFFVNLFLGIWLKVTTNIIKFVYGTLKEFFKIRKENSENGRTEEI